MIDLDAALATWWNTPNTPHAAKPPLVLLDGKRLRYTSLSIGRMPQTKPRHWTDPRPCHILTWIDAAAINHTARIHLPALAMRVSGRQVYLCRTVASDD